MKNLSSYVNEHLNINDERIDEAKYMNFTDDELQHYQDELNLLLEPSKYLKELWRDTSPCNLGEFKKTHKPLPIHSPSKDIFEPDKIYLISFWNPFKQEDKASLYHYEPKEEWDSKYLKRTQALDKEGPNHVITFGFCDQYNVLHLINFYEKDSCTLRYLPNGKYYKYSDGSAYYEKGFFITRKNFESYPIQRYKDKYRTNSFIFKTINHKQKDTTIPVRIDYCYEWSITDDERQKMLDRLASEAKRYDDKKAWDEKLDNAYKTFKNLGGANGWKETPEIVEIAAKDKSDDNKEVCVQLGRCYYQYINFKYKFYYTVDSSD